jgi:hypothetical protein
MFKIIIYDDDKKNSLIFCADTFGKAIDLINILQENSCGFRHYELSYISE